MEALAIPNLAWLSFFSGGRKYAKSVTCVNIRILCISSFDEFAKYDLPASLEFAMGRSGQRRISYVGHSQGTTIGFAAFSQNQTLAAKVDLFIALAPVATVGNMKSPIKYLSYFSGGIQVCKYRLYRVSPKMRSSVLNYNFERNMAIKLLHLRSFGSVFIQLFYGEKFAKFAEMVDEYSLLK